MSETGTVKKFDSKRGFGFIIPDGSDDPEGKGLFVAVKEGHPAFHRWS